MTFRNYLLGKKNLIILVCFINALALFVNFFQIEGRFDIHHENRKKETKPILKHDYEPGSPYAFSLPTFEIPSKEFDWEFYNKTIYVFTCKDDETGFWPFVKFIDFKANYRTEFVTESDMINGVVTKYYPVYEANSYFYGLFYEYDISEFIAYLVLFFLALYIRFSIKIERNAAKTT